MKSVINNKPELKPLRKPLRNYSTPAGAVLWTHLQKSQIQNCKFLRQHSIGNIIADFYCPSEKLVIELDGEDHFGDPGIEKDRVKENYLKSTGIKVIRFENKWVYEDIDWVLENIKAEFNHPRPNGCSSGRAGFYASHKIGPLLEKAGKLHKLFTYMSLAGTKQSSAQLTYIEAIKSENMKYGGCIYLLTNKYHTVLYIGVMSDLKKRMYQHQSKEFNNSFTARFNRSRLVYSENFIRIEEAFAREKQRKIGSREAK